MDNTRLDPGRPAPPKAPDTTQELRNLGEYRLLRRLGEGGMGAVYLGYHEALDRPVAIKVLSHQLMCDQAHIDRFYREAKSGLLLNHPNIVRCLNIGQDRATAKHYLVLEYVDGPSVRELLDRRGSLSVGDALHIVLDIARALEHLHSRNVIHRDIKPDNILTTRSGVAKLADLGLSKRVDEASHLTATRQGFGTTHYMPYEQAVNARKADGRSDIYALGATLYHLVTGEVPFTGENHLEVVQKKDQGFFRPASQVKDGVPAALDPILEKMLARNPRDRYQTASELIVDLERSRLVGRIPSFADLECAKNDPWVQSCLAAATEPTRLDLDTPPQIEQPPPLSDCWILRFRTRAGQLCKARATTAQVVQRIRDNRLPASVELCREGQEVFLPLSSVVEFQNVQAACRAVQRRARPRVKKPSESALRTPRGLSRKSLLLGAVIALVLAVIAFLMVFLY